jgi:hypothetical protein
VYGPHYLDVYTPPNEYLWWSVGAETSRFNPYEYLWWSVGAEKSRFNPSIDDYEWLAPHSDHFTPLKWVPGTSPIAG